MTIHLKQSTQALIAVGPLVDATDGNTLETAISLATGEAALVKNQAAAIVNIGTNTWSSHLGGGLYNLTLTASNTDTLGPLVVVVYDTAHRPFRIECDVLPANVYDARYGTDYLQVDALQINGANTSGMVSSGNTALNADVTKVNTNATAAANLGSGLLGCKTGTVQTGSTTTVVKTNLTEATNDHYNGRKLVFTSGALAEQATDIGDYSGSSKDLTVTALTEAPSNGDTFIII